jgi:hypothetical protein
MLISTVIGAAVPANLKVVAWKGLDKSRGHGFANEL